MAGAPGVSVAVPARPGSSTSSTISGWAELRTWTSRENCWFGSFAMMVCVLVPSWIRSIAIGSTRSSNPGSSLMCWPPNFPSTVATRSRVCPVSRGS